MANKTGQKEIPSTPGHSKFAKKTRTRKLRAESKSKKDLDLNPVTNKYRGYI